MLQRCTEGLKVAFLWPKNAKNEVIRLNDDGKNKLSWAWQIQANR